MIIWIIFVVILGEQPSGQFAAYKTQADCVAARAEALRTQGPPPEGVGVSECVPVKVNLPSA